MIRGQWFVLAPAIALVVGLAAPQGAESGDAAARPARPPAAAARPVTDDYFGTKVTDPYRWMEKLDPETIDWMKAQGRYTRAVLDSIAPRAAFLRDSAHFSGAFGLVKNYAAYGTRAFYLERAPGSDNFDLMVRDAGGASRKLIDMTAFRSEHGGTPYAIDYVAPTPDGHRVAVGISQGGSENAALSVYDAASGKLLAGPLSRVQVGPPAWSDDGATLYLNRLGDTQDRAARYLNSVLYAWDLKGEPVPVFGAPVGHGPKVAPEQFPVVGTWPGATSAAALVVNGVQNELEMWLAPAARAADAAAPWQRLTTAADGVTGAEIRGAEIYLLSHKDAPTFQVLALKAGEPLAAARVLVPARPDRVVESIHAAADGLYVIVREGVYSQLWRATGAGVAAEEIALPFRGSIAEAFSDPRVAGVTITLESWVRAPSVLRFEPAGRRFTDLKLGIAPAYDAARFTVADLKARARDGVEVPLTLIRRAGAQGGEPLILNAYGAYGISTLPNFRPLWIPFMESGAATAYCHVRGGGELGEAWRLGGKDAQKPNTWRDLIACAEELIARGVTTKRTLFIRGGSAGGITMGRAMEERPDLFAGVIDQVPSANTLRYELTPGGPANIPEFGTTKDPQGFKNLLAMDSYQGVRDGVQYPPVLITTGLNDPRVDPWEPAKLAARLQASGTRAPVLLRVVEDAGHGIGATKTQDDELVADIAAFVFWHAGRPGWQPGAT